MREPYRLALSALVALIAVVVTSVFLFSGSNVGHEYYRGFGSLLLPDRVSLFLTAALTDLSLSGVST